METDLELYEYTYFVLYETYFPRGKIRPKKKNFFSPQSNISETFWGNFMH